MLHSLCLEIAACFSVLLLVKAAVIRLPIEEFDNNQAVFSRGLWDPFELQKNAVCVMCVMSMWWRW